METISKLSAMEFKCILPGHGDPCHKKIKETLRQYHDKLIEHEKSIYNVLTQTPKPIETILPFIKKFLPPSFRRKFDGKENPLPYHFESIANLQYLKHMESSGMASAVRMSDGQIMWAKPMSRNRKRSAYK